MTRELAPTSIAAKGLSEVDPEDLKRLIGLYQAGGENMDMLMPEEEGVIRQWLDSVEAEKRGDLDDHLVNLAEHMDETTLSTIAQDVIRWAEDDDDSRKEWKEREERAIKMLGLSEHTVGGADFEGASKVVYPLMGEAIIQFQARAITELWPADGPVHAIIMGLKTPELDQQANRVEMYMNYQYTVEMPGAFDEQDMLLLRLPLSGSCFTKVYPDPVSGTVRRKFVTANDFIVPYHATDLFSATRYTHVLQESVNDVKKKMVSGYYRAVSLGNPTNNRWIGEGEVIEAIDQIEGRSDPGELTDQQYTNLEMHVSLCLEEDPHRDRFGLRTGVARPYVVTVSREHQKVLAIRRNWHPEDPTETKLQHFTHWKFFPGLGFYGFGYLHIIGGLHDATTGAARALLDTAQFANMPGGFMAKTGQKMPEGTFPIKPGEWVEVALDYDSLAKAFYALPYKDTGEGLVRMLELLVEAGKRFASISDAVVGDTPTNAPVGTTLAVIEQAVKLFTGVHKRCHEAMKAEFAIVARVNSEVMLPDQKYPFQVEGGDHFITKADFDARVDVIPVSDPNIVTSSQRIAMAQALMQASEQAPDLYNRREVHRRFLEAIRVPNIDQVLLNPDQMPRQGVVEENMAMTRGQPVKAFIEQDHAAHEMGHQNWFNTLGKDMQTQLMPAYMAHVAEHVAMAYFVEIMKNLGGYPQMQPGQPMPIQIENEIAKRVAMLTQLTPAAIDTPDPAAQQVAAEIQRKDQAAQAETARKDMLASNESDRKDRTAAADIRRDDLKAAADVQREDGQAYAGVHLDALKTGAEVHDKAVRAGADIHQQASTTAAGIQRDDSVASAQSERDNAKARGEERRKDVAKASELARQHVKDRQEAGHRDEEHRASMRHTEEGHRQQSRHAEDDHRRAGEHAEEDHERESRQSQDSHKSSLKQSGEAHREKIRQQRESRKNNKGGKKK